MRDLIDIVENAQMAMIAEAQSAADRFIDRANATIKDRELRLALWAEDYDEVSIQRLSVDPYFRGMGIATAALRKLCQMASRSKITLFLEALPDEDDEDMDQDAERLMRFYARFGFVSGGSAGMMYRPWKKPREEI